MQVAGNTSIDGEEYRVESDSGFSKVFHSHRMASVVAQALAKDRPSNCPDPVIRVIHQGRTIEVYQR